MLMAHSANALGPVLDRMWEVLLEGTVSNDSAYADRKGITVSLIKQGGTWRGRYLYDKTLGISSNTYPHLHLLIPYNVTWSLEPEPMVMVLRGAWVRVPGVEPLLKALGCLFTMCVPI
jgi:hypothetical protein